MDESKEMISIRGREQQELVVLLAKAQSKYGYLSDELLIEMAKSLSLSISTVYGVATFYSFLSTKPLGRNVIRVCKSLPCFLKNYQIITESIERELGIKPGETTPDGKFSFQLTNCIGACDEAPSMMINNDVYNGLTPIKISKILRLYE